jgi:hypothetical protein
MKIDVVARQVRLFLLCGMVFVCLLIGLMQSARAATNWYVTPTGAGNRNGQSWQNAFASVQKALDVVQPGETIYLGDGDYYEAVVTKRRGAANAPITITGSAQAVLRGDPNNAHVLEINHDYYVLDGWTINGYDGKGNSMANYRDKLLYVQGKAAAYGGQVHRGPQGLEVRNMHILNAGGECIRLRYFIQHANIHNNTIQHCGVHDFVFHAGGKNGEGVYVGTSSNQWGDGKNPTSDADQTNFNHIHDNIIDTQGNECVDVKEGASANLVEYNHCTGGKDPESAGLDARGSGNTFRYNTIYGTLGGGIRFGGHTINGLIYGVHNSAYANTMYNNASGGIKFETDPQEPICGNILRGPNGQTQANGAYGSYTDQYRDLVSAVCSSTDTGGSTPAATPEPTSTSTPPSTPEPSNVVVYLSSTSDGKVDNVSFKDEDIVAFDRATRRWQLYFDGSDVGLSNADVDAFALLPDGSLLFSFITETAVPGIGKVDDSDIVRFVPSSLGPTTAGTFQMYFDGSDVGLTENGEDIDALTVLKDGRLIVSTTGNYSVANLAGGNTDLLAFTPRSLGADTAGTWAVYLKGQVVDLKSSSENVTGLWLNEAMPNGVGLYLSTSGNYAVNQLTGDHNDIFFCNMVAGSPCAFQRFWDGDQHSFGAETIDALAMTPGFADAGIVKAADTSDEDGGAEDDLEPAAEVAARDEGSTPYQLFLPVIANQP